MSLAGRCRCDAVSVVTTARPMTVRSCWCADCQKLAAGGPTTNAFFRTEEVVIDGPIKWHDIVAESGNGLTRGFCAECGTPVAIE